MKYEKTVFSVAAIIVISIAILIVRPTAKTPKYSAAGTKKVTGTEPLTVRVFFGNSRFDPEGSGDKVFPVERRITRTQAVARCALEELLEGPTDEEAARDYFTSINTGVKIQRLMIENSVAKVDFNEQLQAHVGGSCRISAIRAQIIRTLKQFPTVDDVIISINGRTRDILQP